MLTGPSKDHTKEQKLEVGAQVWGRDNLWRVMGTRREAWIQHGSELVLHKYLWDKDLRRNNSYKNTQIVYWDYIAEGLEGQVKALSHYISFASWVPITTTWPPCSCWDIFPTLLNIS